MENEQQVSDEQLQQEEENLRIYLDENPLLSKWEPTGLFKQVESNSEKYLISSIMESISYKMFEMKYKDGKSQEDIMKYHDNFLVKMREIGIFNGDFLKSID